MEYFTEANSQKFIMNIAYIHERQKDIVITFQHQEKLIMEMVEYLTEHGEQKIEMNELDVHSMTWMGEALQRFSLTKVENVEQLEAFRIRSDTEVKTKDETELVSTMKIIYEYIFSHLLVKNIFALHFAFR